MDLSAVSQLTPHERRTLADNLQTVARGGVVSVTLSARASERNQAFQQIFTDLRAGGLLRQTGDAPARSTGTLAAARDTRDALEGLALAASRGSDALVIALNEVMAAEAVDARLAAQAKQAEIFAFAREGLLHPDLPPPPGYDRDLRPTLPAAEPRLETAQQAPVAAGQALARALAARALVPAGGALLNLLAPDDDRQPDSRPAPARS